MTDKQIIGEMLSRNRIPFQNYSTCIDTDGVEQDTKVGDEIAVSFEFDDNGRLLRITAP